MFPKTCRLFTSVVKARSDSRGSGKFLKKLWCCVSGDYYKINQTIISLSTRAVIGHFSGPYSPVRPVKI